jgi:outer membrane lipoprotein-sorting protein
LRLCLAPSTALARQDKPLDLKRNYSVPEIAARLVGGFRLVLLGTVLVLWLAPAGAQQNTPLPKPAPKARVSQAGITGSTEPRRPAASSSLLAGNPAMAAPMPNPVIPDPRNRPPVGTTATFDAAQRTDAGKVSAYLSSLQTLIGNFVQVGPDGTRTKGDFYIQKPGKVRFEYDDPSPIAIVADGSSVAVRDRKLATQDIYPLSQTPLRYLLSDRIDLLRDTNVISVSTDDMYITVIIEEKQVLIGNSRLMLMVGVKDGQLKQWTVTDPQGYDTTIAVYNLDSTKKLDPGMFKIDFTNYPTNNN